MKKSPEKLHAVLLMLCVLFVILPICIAPQCLVEDIKVLDNGMPFWYLFIPALICIVSFASILLFEEYYC